MFDQNDGKAVAEACDFQDLFAYENTSRTLAWQLWTKRCAAFELRRTASGKLVGVDPIDPTTLRRLSDGDYEQIIPGVGPIRIPKDVIIWLSAT